MKRRLFLISVFAMCIFVNNPFNSCQWTDYLGNPQRTGYSPCNGPEKPKILWKATIPGDFDTSPFIIDNKVVTVWKNSRFHLSKTKLVLLDILTGETLQEIEIDDHIFKALPIGDEILSISGEKIYQIDLDLNKSIFLASYSEKSFVMTNMYPVVLEEVIILPTTPVISISTSDYHEKWNLNQSVSGQNREPVSLAADETMAILLLRGETDCHHIDIVVLNPLTGTIIWMDGPLPSAQWVTLGEYVYCGGEKLWVFTREGTKQWEFVPEEKIVSNLVLGPDAIYFIDAGNNLYKIRLDGTLVWKTYCEASLWYNETHLLGAKDILYIVSNFQNSQISAFSMEDGSEIWNSDLETPEQLKGLPVAFVKGFPAVANGILVIGTMGGEILALASDPDLFVKQGDAFFEMGSDENAAESYKKALESYEKKGLTEKYQEVLEHVEQYGFTQFGTPEPPVQTQSTAPSETSAPESTPTTTEPSQSLPPSRGPSHIPEYLIVVAGIIGGILVLYMWQKKK